MLLHLLHLEMLHISLVNIFGKLTTGIENCKSMTIVAVKFRILGGNSLKSLRDVEVNLLIFMMVVEIWSWTKLCTENFKSVLGLLRHVSVPS